MSSKLGLPQFRDDSLTYFSERGQSIPTNLCSNLDSSACTREFLIFFIEKIKAFVKQDPFLLRSIGTTITARIEEDNRTHRDSPLSKENLKEAIWQGCLYRGASKRDSEIESSKSSRERGLV